MDDFIYYDATNKQLVREIFRKKRKQKREEKQKDTYNRIKERPLINYENWITSSNGRNREPRIILKIMEGRCLKPCGRECEEYATLILKQINHCSLKNFTYYMNDREFLLKAARITEDPYIVENYFYEYVNEYLKKDPSFRLEFLKQVMLNNNVYSMRTINWFVKTYGFEKEKKSLFTDKEFYLTLKARLEENPELPVYNCSGKDEKELKRYQNAYNSVMVSHENRENGIKGMLSAFTLPKTSEFNPAF